MELNLNLDDEDFCKNDRRLGVKGDTVYEPRQCQPNWFCTTSTHQKSNQYVQELRFAADNAYTKKNYQESIKICNQILDEPEYHKVNIIYCNYFKQDACPALKCLRNALE